MQVKQDSTWKWSKWKFYWETKAIFTSNALEITSHSLIHYVLAGPMKKEIDSWWSHYQKGMMVKEEINDVKLIDTKRQLTDPLTKNTTSSGNLGDILQLRGISRLLLWTQGTFALFWEYKQRMQKSKDGECW